MAEFDGNNELWQLGLDIGPFIQSLQQALEAYNVFSKEFRKTLSVRIDPTSLNALSVAFGTQMRQAVQLLDGAQKETVTKSKKMASEVQKAMKGAFTEGFKELPAATRKAREQAASELVKLTQTAQSEGKKTGKALADGVKDGTSQALRDIKTQADAIKESHASVIAFTKGEQAKADKAANRLQGIVTKQGQHLPAHLREQFFERTQELTPPPPPTAEGKFDTSRLKEQEAEIKRIAAEFASEAAKISQSEFLSGTQISRATQQYERLGATWDNIRAKYLKLSEAAKAKVFDLQKADEARIFEEQGTGAFNEGSRVPFRAIPGQPNTMLEDLQRTVIAQGAGPNGEDIPVQIYKQRYIAALNRNIAAAAAEARDNEKAAKDNQKFLERIETAHQEALIQAQKQLNSLQAQLRSLPPARQQNIPVPQSAEAFIGTKPNGLPAYDPTIAAQLQQEIKQELANASNQNKAFQEFTAATKASAATARGVNNQLEAIEKLAQKKDIDLAEAYQQAFPGAAGPFRAIPQGLVREGDAAAGQATFVSSESAANQLRNGAAALRNQLSERLSVQADAQVQAVVHDLVQKYGTTFGHVGPQTQAQSRLERSVQQIREEEERVFQKLVDDFVAGAMKNVETAGERLSSAGETLKEVPAESAESLRKARALQELNIRAAANYNALQTQVAKLPASRQANISLPATPQGLLKTIPETGEQIIDPNLVDQIRQEVRVELFNVQTQNRAFRDWTTATNATNRIAKSINSDLEDLERRAKKAGIDLTEAFAKAFPGQGVGFRVQPKSLLGQGDVTQGEGIFTPHQPTIDQLRVGISAARASFEQQQAARLATPPPPPIRPLFPPSGGGDDGVNSAKQRLDIENQIGKSILQNATFLAKYVILYRVVHDTARAVENALSGFVRAGIEYNKELETQQLALRGILSENYRIVDARGQEIKGAASVTALQATAVTQWRLIQQASLAVVGSTADLMQLYTGILPFASKLGAGLEQVQSLTKGTAVAARLMDISFQDARSGMVALLQGRALTRNRLVGALGFTRAEIDQLKGTPQLIQAIEDRLSDFLELSDEAQNTFAAMSESFRDFAGIIAAGFTRPLTDGFKQFVSLLTQAGGQFALFEKTAGGFKIKDEVQSFISFTTAAIGQALGPIKEFGREISTNIGENAREWVLALRDALSLALDLAAVLTKLTLATSSWIAQNRVLVEVLLKVTAALAAYLAMRRLITAIEQLSAKSTLLSSVLNANVRTLDTVEQRLASTAASAATTKGAFDLLKGGLASLGSLLGKGLVIGGILFALEKLAEKLFQVYQRAQAVKAQIAALGSGDAGAFAVAATETLKPGASASQKAETIQRASELVSGKVTAVNTLIGSTDLEASNKGQQYKENLAELSKQQESVQKQITDLRARIAHADGQQKTQLEAQLNAAQNTNASIKGRIIDQKEIQNQATSLGQEILTMQGLRPQIDQAIRDLQKDASDASIGTLKSIITAVLNPRQILSLGGLQQATRSENLPEMIRNQIDQVMAQGVAARRRLGIFEEASLPGIEPIPTFDDGAGKQRQTFELLAPKIVKNIKDQLERDIIPIKVAVAEGVTPLGGPLAGLNLPAQIPHAVADAEIQRMSEDAADASIKAWQKEKERFEALLKDKKSAVAKMSKDERENTRQQIENGIEEAKLAYNQLVGQGRIAAAERAKAFKESFSQAEDDILKIEAETAARAQEAALAAYDKRISEVKKRLRDSASTPQDFAQIQTFESQAEALRPFVGSKALADRQVQNAATSLDVARSSEKLLLEQLQSGTIAVSVFLTRVQQVRAAQNAALQDQIEGSERLVSVYDNSLRTGIDLQGNPLTPDAVDQTTDAIKRLKLQIDEAKAAQQQLNDEWAKIELASQAWDNLAGKIAGFLSVAQGLQGTNTFLEKMIGFLGQALDLFNKIQSAAKSFAEIPQAFHNFEGLFQNAGGLGALGGLFTAPFRGHGTPQQNTDVGSLIGHGIGVALPNEVSPTGQTSGIAQSMSSLSRASKGFMSALPAIGIGISAALAIGTAIFQHAVEKAKKDIKQHFDTISKAFNEGDITLGQAIGDLEKERQAMIQKYSSSKSGRKALKDLIPDIDSQIDQMKSQAKQAEKSWQDTLKHMFAVIDGEIKGTLGTGVFGDFYRQLIDLQTTFNTYLDTIDRTTKEGAAKYSDAVEQMDQYYFEFLRETKQKFQEEELDFQSTALSAQEQVFSLLDQQDGLYKQLRSIDEQRQDIAEQMADAQEKQIEQQQQENELAKKELDIRKQIQDVIRQAAQDEIAIRQRGVLEAQLTVAQQKAIEISNVRNKAQEQLDDLRQQLADAQAQAQKQRTDDAKDNSRTQRNFQRQLSGLDEQEAEARKQLRLNDIRLAGARQVAQIEGSVFGMASDEFDLAEKQNLLAVQQAQIQVQKWQDTKALIDSIVETADGVFFNPPEGFPQIKVTLGDITIDNRDQSTNTVGTTPGGGGGGGGGGVREPREPKDRSGKIYAASLDGSYAYDVGDTARRQGFEK